jgi:RNA polymerase sigma-70 factor (ECF subfamily)
MHSFGHLIENEMPRLRRYARTLARDTIAADDLVQDCLARALAKSHLWQAGTDLRAWLFTILHNQYVNQVRRAVREGVSVIVDDVEPSLTFGPTQHKKLELRDLERALGMLPEEQRAVILLLGLEWLRYEEVAAILYVLVGTVRPRLSRPREMLRHLMGMTASEEVAEAARRSRCKPVGFTIDGYMRARRSAPPTQYFSASPEQPTTSRRTYLIVTVTFASVAPRRQVS